MEKVNEILKICDITKYYGDKCILDNISFSVMRGEALAVTGKSGAGKSTLLSIIGALDKPDSGTVYFDGKPVLGSAMRKYRRSEIGFVFQDSCLIDEYTAYENVLSAVKLSHSKENPAEYLSLVGLSGKEESYPEKLSGGEARRVSLARAMAKKPKILLLDEPTEGLDGETGLDIMNLTLKLCRESETSVIMVTHNMDFARLMSRQLHLDGGRIIEGGGTV